ncbi:oxygen-independent coproporphyrinogen III oxidase [Lachnospiraceae bacterium MD329]|nr:oxygen-independent coproporphyrinogen III oxidase [Lachnospiraceae bacterium MD329]
MTGLYIHIPFCKQKCKYCDFVSFSGMENLTDQYIDALENEARRFCGEKIDTVFIGGGTPTVLTAKQLRRIVGMCFNLFDISNEYEFTIEANPGTLDDDKISSALGGGVNRISVGVQSFNDNELRRIGRIHNAETAYNTICHLKKMGFDNINVDLMTALPSQTEQSLMSTLKTVAELPVKHISAYSLIIEEGTPIAKEYDAGVLDIPDEDTERSMYNTAADILKSNGFLQYEISNFAVSGFECRHNIKYWTAEKYIGLGAAAHSYDGKNRYFNTSDIKAYLQGAPREKVILTEQDRISEFIITGLRMISGIDENVFLEKFGKKFDRLYGAELNKFISMGLMTYDNGRYALTPRGIDVSNSILCEFV